MSASLQVPLSVVSKTREGLTREIAKVQVKEGGKVSIVAIYYDTSKKEHVAWYLPIKYFGNGTIA